MEKETKKEVKEKVEKNVSDIEAKMTEKELRKKYGEKSTFKKVINVILWIVLLGWMALVLIDFYQVHKEKEPYFCLKTGINKYKDGDVKWCLGAGYKVYRYNRKCFSGKEFGPFWSEDRSLNNEGCKKK